MADISVVIPCHNAERWVARAIRSVLAAPDVGVDVVVVDDGSTDASLDVVKSFGDRVRWESGPNRGACAARNLGLARADAPYVMFLDADDYVEGNFLTAAVEAMATARADLGFGRLAAEVRDGRRWYEPGPLTSHLDAVHLLLEHHFIPPCATVWRRGFVQDIGGWLEGLRRNQDFEIVFRALARRPRVTSWSTGAGVYVQHGDGGRISAKVDHGTVDHQVEVLRSTLRYLTMAGLDEADARRLVRRKAYLLYRSTARHGHDESVATVEDLWRELGGRWHSGNWRHVAFSALLGLRRKERVSVWLASQR